MPEVLGIDIGGVIIDRIANDDTDTSFFTDNYLRTTPVLGAFEAIARLISERFGRRNVHLISKAGEKVQAKTLHWFEHHRFFEQTGVLPENVHFCLTREEKAPLCKDLGVTHFVDDKLEVHSYLFDFVMFRYLFMPSEREVERYRQFLPGVIHIENWNELLVVLLEAD